MSAEAAGVPPTAADTRIHITHRTARWDDRRYWNEARQRVVIDDVVRSYLHDVIDLRMVSMLLGPVFVPLLRFLTVGFLEPVFREALQVEWTPGQQRRFETCF